MEEKIIYNWKFEDKKNRSTLWYIIAISIIISVVIWGFLTEQYGLSFIVLLLTGLTVFVENNSDDEVEVFLTELGIKVGDSFFDYSKIKSYSFIYNKENAIFLRLNLHTKGIKYINIIINNDISNELKNILPELVEEDPKGELSFSEKIIFLLKL